MGVHLVNLLLGAHAYNLIKGRERIYGLRRIKHSHQTLVLETDNASSVLLRVFRHKFVNRVRACKVPLKLGLKHGSNVIQPASEVLRHLETRSQSEIIGD